MEVEMTKVRNPKGAGKKKRDQRELKIPKSYKFFPEMCDLLEMEGERSGQTETAIVEEAIAREMQRRGYVIAQNGYLIQTVKRKGAGDGDK